MRDLHLHFLFQAWLQKTKGVIHISDDNPIYVLAYLDDFLAYQIWQPPLPYKSLLKRQLWPQKETVRFIRKHAKSSRENGSVRVRERQLATPWTWTFLDIVVSKLSLSIYNSFSRIVYTVSITAIIPRKGSARQDHLITHFAVVLQ